MGKRFRTDHLDQALLLPPCPASTILSGQRQLFLPIGDNYELCVAAFLLYTGADRSRG